MNSFIIAAMSALGATLAQILHHYFILRREEKQRKQRTIAIIESMISDLDYCSLFLQASFDNISKSSGYISSRSIDVGTYQAFSESHFQIEDLIQTGLYHRYQIPVRFAHELCKLYLDRNEYTVSHDFIKNIKFYAENASYLADALEKQIKIGGGDIPDFAEYDQELIQRRMSKGRITTEAPSN